MTSEQLVRGPEKWTDSSEIEIRELTLLQKNLKKNSIRFRLGQVNISMVKYHFFFFFHHGRRDRPAKQCLSNRPQLPLPVFSILRYCIPVQITAFPSYGTRKLLLNTVAPTKLWPTQWSQLRFGFLSDSHVSGRSPGHVSGPPVIDSFLFIPFTIAGRRNDPPSVFNCKTAYQTIKYEIIVVVHSIQPIAVTGHTLIVPFFLRPDGQAR